MLSPKERLDKVFSGEKVDRPPCICPGGMMNMVTTELIEEVGIKFPEAHMSAQMMAGLSEAVYERGCFENYGVPFCMTIEAENFGAKVDMGTKIYEPHVVEYSIDSVKEWKKISQINFTEGRAKVVIEAIKLLKSKGTDVPIIGNLTGPISTASSIMEPSTFYKELKKSNKEAHEFLNFVTDELITFAKKQIEAGADIIAISDPSGTGEILGPKLFEEFAVKYINKIIESVQKQNKSTIVHICGQMKRVYSEVNKVKSNALSFDSIVNMSDARKNLKDRVLMGNVSTYAIEFGEAKKIAELTEKCVKDGSNIISPACGLGMKSPLKNVKAMLEYLSKGDGDTNA
ncbi:methylcobamide:CoM methyltransferase MtbA [Clostridium autoethanogenum]|uniref:MtaA/CmuA family methyltransferase n=1 Tax=Clostridium autoethanogenum DSM 10061 TaxID=1341692 RepID=A0ABM5P074_9CLOT|nr:methylcobamide:CoM methyltransferase MtbA [Clostridium autoethanogenum]AGY78247.1 MtaA/CmuA family methyltransferase [Clostridium autoethanogenum DSM 10061]ALU38379.1 Methyltransferase MtaA/CmuA family [Clostridium autoethanogenum DSM 10061]OVY51135.1 Uroporphyrinogen decarboxylase [Clostridium autoethanogenum]